MKNELAIETTRLKVSDKFFNMYPVGILHIIYAKTVKNDGIYSKDDRRCSARKLCT